MGDVRAIKLLERARQLKVRMAAEDSFELIAWRQLLDDMRGVPMDDDLRALFEELVALFPTAVGIWARYVEAEMAAGNGGGVKAVFGRCLMQCPSVDLWYMYLKFIKRSNESRGPEGVLESRQAYEFTLDTIGHDIHAGPLWQEYLAFLASPKPGSQAYAALWASGLVGGQEEAARTAALRRTYQRAVVVPSHSLELIWKNYEAFEAGAAATGAAGGNVAAAKTLAARVLAEQRPRFQAARMAYRERKRKMEGLDPAALPAPPGKGGPGQAEQAKLWKAWLEYEASNPQRLEPAALAARVDLAYLQALMVLLHYPEVWADYARWHTDCGGGPARAIICLSRAVAALPGCLLLHFALADAHESQGDAAAAKQVYEALAAQLEPTAAAAEAHRTAVAAAAARPGSEPPPPLAPAGGPLCELPADQAALVWIQYMRFARRTESLTACRKMFIRAKKAPNCPWQVYAAAALLEARIGRSRDVARKIFEKGLELPRYAACPDFVLAYAAFLLDAGDADNARALFERGLTEEPNRRCPALWEAYLAFEFEQGDLGAALRLEKRAREALAEAGGPASSAASRSLQLLLLRYAFGDCLPLPPAHASHVLHLVGKGPPPAGSERGRRSGPGGAEPGPGGPRPWSDEGDPRGWDHPREREPRDGGGGWDRDGPVPVMPLPLDRFIRALPPAHFLDGPLPDLTTLVDALLDMPPTPPAADAAQQQQQPDGQRQQQQQQHHQGAGQGGAPEQAHAHAHAAQGIKREWAAAEPDLEGGMAGRDIYALRAKQRARLDGGAG